MLDTTTELWRLTDQDLIEALVAQETAMRQVYAGMVELWSEAEARGGFAGYSSLIGFAQTQLRLSNAEIRSRGEDRDALHGSRALGEQIAPRLPETAKALAAGEIGVEHAQLIDRYHKQIPAHYGEGDRAQAEQTLVELARSARPEALRTAGREMVRLWQADGAPPPEPPKRPDQEFRYRKNKQGEMVFSGHLSPENSATLEGLFGTLAKPRKGPDGSRDLRSREERQGDALGEIINAAAHGDDNTVQGGERAVMTVTTTLKELESRLNGYVFDVPGIRSLDELRKLACEAAVVPAVFGNDGEVLYLGREQRYATTAQRRALVLRDKGCCAPWCDRRPKWTVAHHIPPWSDGGHTDIDQMALLCQRDHHIAHHTDWTLRMGADGLPEWIPPPSRDPDQEPIRNTIHRAVSEQHAGQCPGSAESGGEDGVF